MVELLLVSRLQKKHDARVRAQQYHAQYDSINTAELWICTDYEYGHHAEVNHLRCPALSILLKLNQIMMMTCLLAELLLCFFLYEINQPSTNSRQASVPYSVSALCSALCSAVSSSLLRTHIEFLFAANTHVYLRVPLYECHTSVVLRKLDYNVLIGPYEYSSSSLREELYGVHYIDTAVVTQRSASSMMVLYSYDRTAYLVPACCCTRVHECFRAVTAACSMQRRL